MDSQAHTARGQRRRSPGQSSQRSDLWRALEGRTTELLAGFLALTLVVAAAVVGTVHRSTLLAVAPLALVAAWFATRLDGRRAGTRDGRDVDLAVPSAILLVLAGLTALQAIPLPIGLLAVVAPRNADIWGRALAPFGEAVTWGSISLDPGASLAEALKLCIYAAVMLAAATLAASSRTRAWPLIIVFGAAILVALTAAAHDLAGATRLFGIYEPRTPVEPRHMAPFLNPNNLAGYLDLGVFCGVGLILTHDRVLPAWAVGVGIALLVGASIRSASRGGVAVLVVGLVLLGVLLLWARRRHGVRREWAKLLIPGAALLAGLLLAVAGGTFGVWNELFQDNVSKLRVLPSTLPLVSDFRWLGIGRGAFESVFSAYQLAPAPNMVITHPENFVVHWLAEWGVLVGGGLLLALTWMLRPAALGATRSGLAAGAWVGVIVLLVQNLADLGIEIAGVTVALACVLGALWGMRRRRPRTKGAGARSSHKLPAARAVAASLMDKTAVTRGMIALGGVVAVAMVASGGLRDVRADRAHLQARFERIGEGKDERAQAWTLVGKAMLEHPADYYFPLLGGAMAWRFQDRNPIPWIQRALERAPLSGRAHLLLADVVAARGATAQALFELRLAAEYEPPLGGSTASRAARWSRSFDDVMRAVPESAVGVSILDTVAGKVKDAEIIRRADEEILRRDPTKIGPRQRVVFARIQALQREGDGLCVDRAKCQREVEEQCEALQRLYPDSSLAAQLRADLLTVMGKTGEAAALLGTACALPRERSGCLQRQVSALAAIGKTADLHAAL
ncbi:MAG: O-antigen ligase family protein [Polyangiaceae bacterium]